MKRKLLEFIFHNKWLIGFNLLGLYLFAKMAEDVIEKEYIVVIDRWISIHVNEIQNPLLNDLMVTITNLNGAVGIAAFSFFVIIFLGYKKWYKDLWFYLLSVGGAGIAFIAIKLMVQRVRPSSDIIDVAGYSFPSAHSTMAAAVVLTVYMIFSKRLHSISLRLFLLIVCLSWALLIAFSRIYLDVHWLSDVISGLGLGLFWVTFLTLLREWYRTA